MENEIHVAYPISSKENTGVDNLFEQIIRILENKKSKTKINEVDFESSNHKNNCCRV